MYGCEVIQHIYTVHVTSWNVYRLYVYLLICHNSKLHYMIKLYQTTKLINTITITLLMKNTNSGGPNHKFRSIQSSGFFSTKRHCINNKTVAEPHGRNITSIWAVIRAWWNTSRRDQMLNWIMIYFMCSQMVNHKRLWTSDKLAYACWIFHHTV